MQDYKRQTIFSYKSGHSGLFFSISAIFRPLRRFFSRFSRSVAPARSSKNSHYTFVLPGKTCPPLLVFPYLLLQAASIADVERTVLVAAR